MLTILELKIIMMNGLNRIAIYTCITGGYDIPTDGFEHKEGYDYLLFSEAPIQTKSWKNLIASFNSESNLTVVKKQRFIKTHPFDILKDYDIVVWIDGNTDVNEKLYKYVEENKDNIITFKKHPDRDCIYKEIKTVIKGRKEEREIGELVYNNLMREGYPVNNGLFETNIIILHPNNEDVKTLFNAWWREIEKFSKRDQLSLNYVIWKLHYENLVTVRETSDFKPKLHKRI